MMIVDSCLPIWHSWQISLPPNIILSPNGPNPWSGQVVTLWEADSQTKLASVVAACHKLVIADGLWIP